MCSKVYADSFFSAGNIENSKMYATIAFGVEPAPAQRIGGWIVKRDGSICDDNGAAITQFRFLDLAFLKNNVYRRGTEHGESINVSPGDIVGLWLYPYNETGHVVGAKNGWVFLGPYQQPTIADILDVGAVSYRNIVYFEQGALKTKGGESVSVGPLGNFQLASLGGYAQQAKKILSGVVRHPIDVFNTQMDCLPPGNPVLSLELRNVGSQAELISLSPNLSVELTPGEHRVVDRLVLPLLSEKHEIGVESSMTRCLVNVRDEKVDHPDNHALLLSRNDENQWLWGGISVEIPPDRSGGLYCITRVPYRLVFELPKCTAPPSYTVQAPVRIYPEIGEHVRLEVKIGNSGGGSANPLIYFIKIRETLTSYIAPPPNFLSRKLVDGVVWYQYENAGLPTGGNFVINIDVVGFVENGGIGEVIIQAEDQRAATDIESKPKPPTATFTPTVSPEISPILPSMTVVPLDSFFRVTSIQELSNCGHEYREWEVAIEVNTMNLSEIQLPLAVDSTLPTAHAVTLELFWESGKGTFTLKTGELSRVSLLGNFSKGVYRVLIRERTLPGVLLLKWLTAGGVTARLPVPCASSVTNSAPYAIQNALSVNGTTMPAKKDAVNNIGSNGSPKDVGETVLSVIARKGLGGSSGVITKPVGAGLFLRAERYGVSLIAAIVLALFVGILARKSRRK
jgi:hypothetical protein